jgi:hypothetical protein
MHAQIHKLSPAAVPSEKQGSAAACDDPHGAAGTSKLLVKGQDGGWDLDVSTLPFDGMANVSSAIPTTATAGRASSRADR